LCRSHFTRDGRCSTCIAAGHLRAAAPPPACGAPGAARFRRGETRRPPPPPCGRGAPPRAPRPARAPRSLSPRFPPERGPPPPPPLTVISLVLPPSPMVLGLFQVLACTSAHDARRVDVHAPPKEEEPSESRE